MSFSDHVALSRGNAWAIREEGVDHILEYCESTVLKSRNHPRGSTSRAGPGLSSLKLNNTGAPNYSPRQDEMKLS